MTQTLSTINQEVRTHWRTLLLWGLAYAVLAQVLMLIALMVRFQAIPNYGITYDWIGNVVWIIKSTPSWNDIPQLSPKNG